MIDAQCACGLAMNPKKLGKVYTKMLFVLKSNRHHTAALDCAYRVAIPLARSFRSKRLHNIDPRSARRRQHRRDNRDCH